MNGKINMGTTGKTNINSRTCGTSLNAPLPERRNRARARGRFEDDTFPCSTPLRVYLEPRRDGFEELLFIDPARLRGGSIVLRKNDALAERRTRRWHHKLDRVPTRRAEDHAIAGEAGELPAL